MTTCQRGRTNVRRQRNKLSVQERQESEKFKSKAEIVRDLEGERQNITADKIK